MKLDGNEHDRANCLNVDDVSLGTTDTVHHSDEQLEMFVRTSDYTSHTLGPGKIHLK